MGETPKVYSTRVGIHAQEPECAGHTVEERRSLTGILGADEEVVADLGLSHEMGQRLLQCEQLDGTDARSASLVARPVDGNPIESLRCDVEVAVVIPARKSVEPIP